MDDLLSEKEQIEQIRNWWSEYGGYIIFGVAAGALLLFGWNYYQDSQLNKQLEASALYETLTNHVVSGDLEEAEEFDAHYREMLTMSQHVFTNCEPNREAFARYVADMDVVPNGAETTAFSATRAPS